MRSLATIATALALAMPGMIARAAPPPECAAIPAPADGDLAAYRRSAAWGPGLRAFEAGRLAQARKLLESAWTRVRADLAAAFATDRCDEAGIARTLGRRVFAPPPDALPAEDRFVPPRPVALALARTRCAAGATAEAGTGLLDTTDPSDAPARAAASVLLAAAGRPQVASALIPPSAADPWWQAARAFVEAPDPASTAAALERLAALAEGEVP